jgi:ribosome-associated translation inhibitor RaiA
MTIQINTDNNITGSERLSAYIKTLITKSIKRFDDQLTRIEVYLADENSDKSGIDDKRCTLEARLEGMNPLAATGYGNTIEEAIRSAAEKLKSALDSATGRLKKY